jgi:UDPglucose 6-dehydrogenase
MTNRICVLGAGRLGAVAAACLADIGHTVSAVDTDSRRVRSLARGDPLFHEPGLTELLQRNLANDRLSFTTRAGDGMRGAEFVLIAVDTPQRQDGAADLSALHTAAREIAPYLEEETVIVIRSTVPPGSCASLAPLIRSANPNAGFEIVANPEFLREWRAVDDFLKPDRIVIGSDNRRAARRVASLYRKLRRPTIVCDLATAEMIKYAANAYLAASISFINEIANICDGVGADVSQVAQALAMDKRIGQRAYLSAGIGFGGGCLPKDISALAFVAQAHGYPAPMLRSVMEVNDLQPRLVLVRLQETFPDLAGVTIAVLGLSFKGDTFDLRWSPALAVVRLLAEAGARVRVFDPLAGDLTATELAEAVQVSTSVEQAVIGAQALVIATEHQQLRELNLPKLRSLTKGPLLIDGRNLLDPAAAADAGFTYVGIGRKAETIHQER